MKSKAHASTEYTVFQSALRRVLRLSKDDLNQMIAADKQAKAGKPKRGPKPKHSSASDRASSDKD